MFRSIRRSPNGCNSALALAASPAPARPVRFSFLLLDRARWLLRRGLGLRRG